MTLLSSHLLIQTSSLTLITISYFLLTSPLTLLTSRSLDLLGSSMHIKAATYIPAGASAAQQSSNPLASIQSKTLPHTSRELLGLLALVIFLAGVSQSVLASGLSFSQDSLLLTHERKRKETQVLGEEIRALYGSQNQWMTLAGLRVVVMGCIVGWIYGRYSSRNVLGISAGAGSNSGFALLANRVTFAVGLCDMLFWGYLWTVIREEKREVAELVARRRAQDDEDER